MSMSKIRRREFLKMTGLGAVAMLAPKTAKAQPSKQKLPNIVFFLADDLGYGDPECLNPDSKIPTPFINRLAQQGMTFTDAHSPSAVCTPTRYGILTGRYCWRSALKSSVLWPWDPPLIEKDRLTLPKMLKQHGYTTACIGKWHLGWNWPLTDGSHVTDHVKGHRLGNQRSKFGKKIDFTRPILQGPTTRGFDYYFGTAVPNFPPYCFIENDRTVGLPTQTKPGNMFGSPGPMLPGWKLEKILPTLGEKAVAFIDSHATKNEDKPFFLFFTSTAPHTPISPDKRFLGKSKAGLYGDFVHQVDWTFGQIIKALDRHGLAEKTIVIFTSDNGSPARNGKNASGPTGSVPREFGHHPSYIYRGMKADAWEGGHRIPCLIRWPNKIKASSTCDQTICLSDFMSTIAKLIDHSLPADAGEDSYDISPLWFGRTDKIIRPATVHHSINGTFAIRQGKWKLILGKNSGGFTQYRPPKNAPPGQLYDMKADPREKNNLWSEQQDIVNELTALLEKYKADGRTAPRLSSIK